jgi:hypothetical protein
VWSGEETLGLLTEARWLKGVTFQKEGSESLSVTFF